MNSKNIITFFKNKFNLLCIDISNYIDDKFISVFQNYFEKKDKQTFIIITNNKNHKKIIVKSLNKTNIPSYIYDDTSFFLSYKSISMFFNDTESLYLAFKKTIEETNIDDCIICYENIIKNHLFVNCCTYCSIKVCSECSLKMERFEYKDNVYIIKCPVCKEFIHTY